VFKRVAEDSESFFRFLHFSVEFIQRMVDCLLVASRHTNRTNQNQLMNSIATKINREAHIICKRYIEVLENGNEPATLLSQIEHSKYDIMESINDARLNMHNTIERVRSQAHYNIKCELQLRPELAQRLIDFRKARQARDEQEASNEQRNWIPLPVLA
jgi:hypothetical protein